MESRWQVLLHRIRDILLRKKSVSSLPWLRSDFLSQPVWQHLIVLSGKISPIVFHSWQLKKLWWRISFSSIFTPRNPGRSKVIVCPSQTYLVKKSLLKVENTSDLFVSCHLYHVLIILEIFCGHILEISFSWQQASAHFSGALFNWCYLHLRIVVKRNWRSNWAFFLLWKTIRNSQQRLTWSVSMVPKDHRLSQTKIFAAVCQE